MRRRLVVAKDAPARLRAIGYLALREPATGRVVLVNLVQRAGVATVARDPWEAGADWRPIGAEELAFALSMAAALVARPAEVATCAA